MNRTEAFGRKWLYGLQRFGLPYLKSYKHSYLWLEWFINNHMAADTIQTTRGTYGIQSALLRISAYNLRELEGLAYSMYCTDAMYDVLTDVKVNIRNYLRNKLEDCYRQVDNIRTQANQELAQTRSANYGWFVNTIRELADTSDLETNDTWQGVQLPAMEVDTKESKIAKHNLIRQKGILLPKTKHQIHYAHRFKALYCQNTIARPIYE